MNEIELNLTLISNISKCLEQFSYSPAIFALKLNSFLNEDHFSIQTIYSWINNKTMPSIYETYVISTFFRIPVNELVNPNFNITTAFGRSFAPQPTEIEPSPYTKLSELLDTAMALTESAEENTNMATKNTNRIINISRKSKKSMEEVVYAHTTSRNGNILLANKIYNSGLALKTVAEKVGKSTRSLRDYAFYNVSVPSDTASKLVKFFKTSYRNLGLVYNADTDRYEHMKISVKN